MCKDIWYDEFRSLEMTPPVTNRPGQPGAKDTCPINKMKETNGNVNMKARAFPGVDLHPVKKVKVKAKKTRLTSLNIGTVRRENWHQC
ncbi:unnamed protein product [Gordionus sp. m RMFG-2023]